VEFAIADPACVNVAESVAFGARVGSKEGGGAPSFAGEPQRGHSWRIYFRDLALGIDRCLEPWWSALSGGGMCSIDSCCCLPEFSIPTEADIRLNVPVLHCVQYVGGRIMRSLVLVAQKQKTNAAGMADASQLNLRPARRGRPSGRRGGMDSREV